MIHSSELGELASALATAQGGFEAVSKDSANPFFKSSYASLPAVVQAASPILVENGLSVCQLLGHDEQGDTLTTVLLHTSGQFLGDTMHLRPVKNDPQAQGSATTYGRRYAYMAALGLVADEDDDGNAGSAAKPAAQAKPKAKPKPKASKKPQEAKPPNATEPDEDVPPPEGDDRQINEAEVKALSQLCTEAKWDEKTLRWQLVAIGIEDTDDLGAAVRQLTASQAATMKESLRLTIEGGFNEDA